MRLTLALLHSGVDADFIGKRTPWMELFFFGPIFMAFGTRWAKSKEDEPSLLNRCEKELILF